MKRGLSRWAVSLAAVVLLSGCGTIKDWFDGGIEKNDKWADAPAEMISYGIDNSWMNIDASDLGDRLVKDGRCTMTSIEFLGWASTGYYKDPSPLYPKFDNFLKVMRERRIWVFVSLSNDNKGQGKYGDDKNKLDKYKPQLQAIVAYMKGKGPEGLIIQPVAETQTDTGSWMEQYCAQQLVGYRLCWNHGSRPSGAPAGWWSFAYHPGALSDKGKVRGMTITDHSRALVALEAGEISVVTLNIGGDLYGLADPAKLEAYTKEVLKTKDRGFGYYGFGHKVIDVEGIKAIGRAVAAVR